MKQTQEMELTALLFKALASDFGLEVSTSNPKLLRNKLYKIRRENQMFACLSIVLPATENTLLVVKKPEQEDAKES